MKGNYCYKSITKTTTHVGKPKDMDVQASGRTCSFQWAVEAYGAERAQR
jgi:hypothetical protein